MEQIKQLTNAVDSATSDMLAAPTIELYAAVQRLLATRADMAKHLVAHCLKRLMIKNRKVLFLTMDMLEYISYQTELSFYSQIATKDFLLRVSGLLQSKDLDEAVINKILSTIRCWEELFKPHQDLLPMFFQFYEGLMKKGYDTKKDYVSPYRPKELKKYPSKAEQQKKVSAVSSTYKTQSKPQKSSGSGSQSVSALREQITLTNEVIDGCDPAEGVSANPLLTDLMTGLKEGEKRMLKVINEQSNEKVVEQAIAINDDLIVTFRRYKFLQQNKKPEPFIKTELASNFIAPEEKPKGMLGPKAELPRELRVSKPASIFDDFDIKETTSQPAPPPPKPQKKVQANLMDMDYEAPKPQPPQPIRTNPPAGTSLFDMIDLNAPSNPPPAAMNTLSTSMQQGMGTNSLNLMGMMGGLSINPAPTNPYGGASLNINQFGMGGPVQPPAAQTNSGFNLLGANPGPTIAPNLINSTQLPYQGNFSTEVDFKQYNENSLTDLSDWFAKK